MATNRRAPPPSFVASSFFRCNPLRSQPLSSSRFAPPCAPFASRRASFLSMTLNNNGSANSNGRSSDSLDSLESLDLDLTVATENGVSNGVARKASNGVANGVPNALSNGVVSNDVASSSSIGQVDTAPFTSENRPPISRHEFGNAMIGEEDDDEHKEGPSDLARVGVVAVIVAIISALLQHDWVNVHRDLTMEIIFIAGYLGITLEEILCYDKTGVALLMGVGMWATLTTANPLGFHGVEHMLSEQLSDISQILFFLIGAMTIVEIIDGHRGFKVVTDFITTNNRKFLMWTVALMTFFTSAILDNLTSTIVVVSLLRKLVKNKKERWLLGAVTVIAANAGGAWTPIGDVTTTQLWLHGNISAFPTMRDLIVPSLVSMATTVGILSAQVEGSFERPVAQSEELAPRARLVFYTGLSALVSVPIFKTVTGLPPYIGMLFGLGTLWVMTDSIHAGENRDSLRGLAAIKRIDTSSVLFFLGILLAVGGLESAGILSGLASWLDQHILNRDIIAALVGLFSAVVDNVPLVAATMGMYSLDEIRPDSQLWQLIAYCAGTGGSILIIGSAAGVAFMGMEKVDFGWYARKISIPTLVGFFAGMGTYLVQQNVIPHIAGGLIG